MANSQVLPHQPDTPLTHDEYVQHLLAELLAEQQQTRLQISLWVECCGGLRGLLQTEAKKLTDLPGLDSAIARKLDAIRQLARIYFEESLPAGATISSPTDTEQFLKARLQDLPHEVFCCIYLDNRHRLLRFEELFRGTIDGSVVYPREVVKQALAANAAAVILAHNHPSGNTQPSDADQRITRRIRDALSLVDIRLLDHLIIGSGESTSLASRGML